MWKRSGSRFSHCDGLSRRGFLEIGALGLGGLTLADVLRARAAARQAGESTRKTSVIFIEMAGGPSQHETYDPKPEAPVEYRGLYGAIPTNVPGVFFSDRLPHQSAVMDKVAIVRSVHHESGNHQMGAHLVQTGYYLRDRRSAVNEMPSVGSVTAKVRGPNAHGIPPYVSVYTPMRYGGSAYIGHGFDPFVAQGNPNLDDYQVKNLSLIAGMNEIRLGDRRSLQARFDHAARRIDDPRGVADALDDFGRQAFDIVTGDRARDAFDIGREDPRTRDRYGRTLTGQSLLLARRVVEAGATFAHVQATEGGGWDYHWNLQETLNRVAPPYDQGIAALISDLYDRGLEKDVLVVAMGEFGRTPKMNNGLGEGTPGRDHWGHVMSVLLAGGGLPGGVIVGQSDSHGGEPAEAPYRPQNILAMIYRHLGIDPRLTLPDHTGRPRHLLDETGFISELL